MGDSAPKDTRIYLTGGATAVLLGWRDTTLDVDLKIVPETDEVLRAIPELKEALRINVELAGPDQFIPALPEWEARSPWIVREGRIDRHHYDPYSQCLAKIERGHEQDRLDVAQLFRQGLVKRGRLRELFEAIRPQLIRFPAIDPAEFARQVEEALTSSA